jgi:hypothetical protein
MREMIKHKARQFLANAEMCRRLGGKSLSDEDRAVLFEMAEHWETMADHVRAIPSAAARGIAEPDVIPFRVTPAERRWGGASP